MHQAELRRFLGDDRGAGTVWALTWLVLLLGIGGLAVDTTVAFRTKTMLQATADAAALAGTIDLPVNGSQSGDRAVEGAVDMARKNMRTAEHGTVLTPWEVAVGDWDHAGRTLVGAASDYPNAVLVTARRDEVNQNPVPLLFLRILGAVGVGFDHWNVYAQAAAERFIPQCILRQGLIARGVVDMQSNNVMRGDLCIHAEDHVEVNNNNIFLYREGVTVGMPDQTDLVVANWNLNDGLAEALRSERLDPKMVDHVAELLATLRQPSLDAIDQRTDIVPSYIADKSDAAVVNWSRNEFDPAELAVTSLSLAGPQRIYNVECSGNQQITLDLPGNQRKLLASPLIMKDFVLVSNCRINLGADILLSNVVLASDGGNDSLHNANLILGQGDILGAPDDCLEGGGVQIFSTTNVKGPAQLTMHGVQIVAAGDISIAAQAYGLNGVNFQAGGDIDISSNNDLGAFGVCHGGAPNLLTVDYYRLVY